MGLDDFRGKIAVITGGGSGIGAGVARALADEGAHVAVADIDYERASTVSETCLGRGTRSIAVGCDVRDQESVDSLALAVLAEFGGVDLLFNNAGVFIGGEMEDVTWDDWRFILDVNVDGAFRVGQRFTEIFRSQARNEGRRGYVVNTASVAGLMTTAPQGLAYGVSKAAMVAYSELMRMDLEELGIGVSTLCPGAILTDLTSSDRIRSPGEKRSGTSDLLAPFIEGGMAPDEVGPIVLSGIRRNLPYIFTHGEFREDCKARFDRVLLGFEEISR